METREIKTKLDGDGDDDDDDDVDLLHLEVILPFVVKSSLQTAEIWSDWHHTKRCKSKSLLQACKSQGHQSANDLLIREKDS